MNFGRKCICTSKIYKENKPNNKNIKQRNKSDVLIFSATNLYVKRIARFLIFFKPQQDHKTMSCIRAKNPNLC